MKVSVLSEREAMEFDVLIVGGGPAGLAAACKLRQLCNEQDLDLSVCLIEKGSEIGAHILSGAVIEPRALNELFPDWQENAAPLNTPVTQDDVLLMTGPESALRLPSFLVPAGLHNEGNHVASLGQLCRWLGEQAEALGVEVLSGFAANEVLYDETGAVCGVATGEMGRTQDGQKKAGFEPGYELRARYTLFAEGCRGHLGKSLIRRFSLDRDSDPQHYGIGLKEIWEVPDAVHRPGQVMHGLGWPLSLGRNPTGGSFLYHMQDNQVVVGLIVDLNYRNPWLDPFEEFQKLKHHPHIRQVLENGKRIAYGARALTKGGLQSLPDTVFPGGLLIGDDAGTLNFLKLKGSHTAMKSGMLAAESIIAAWQAQPDAPEQKLTDYRQRLTDSWVHKELHESRNCAPAIHRFGTLLGAAYCFVDQTLFRGRLPFTLHDRIPDYATLDKARNVKPLVYDKPDGKLSFDRLSSVYLSNTNHAEDQPAHLHLRDFDIPIQDNLPRYAEPALRYCPAAVYEVVEEAGQQLFRINAQNCVHCKTCDIKDPAQNIHWVAPEGGGGPNYPNM